MNAILPFLISILGPMLFGGNKSGSQDMTTAGRQTRTVTTPASGYQSPLVGLLDPMMANMLAQNVKRGSNWGWPAGQGIDTSWIDQMLSLLGGQWTKLLEGYESGNMGGGKLVKGKADLSRLLA
jgi:hypothetical protein